MQRLVLFVIAAIALSQASIVCADEKPTSQPSQLVGGVSDADAKALRTLLGQLTNTAMAKNSFHDLTQFLQLDPNSAPANFRNYDDINNALDLVQRDWKYKYSGEFKISADNELLVFDDIFHMAYADAGKGARVASDRQHADPPAVDPHTSAVVAVEPSQEMNAVSLNLAGTTVPVGWKIALPRGVDETAIHDSLLKQLNILHDQRNNWPTDKTSAYRIIIDRVLTAFADAAPSTAN